MTTFWFDANLSPQIATWTAATFGVECAHMDALGFRTTTDRTIFDAARAHGEIVIITKDADFVRLLEDFGPPPKILWLTTGNTSNATLRAVFAADFITAISLLSSETPLVEIG